MSKKRAAGIFKMRASHIIEGTAERCFDNFIKHLEDIPPYYTQQQILDVMRGRKVVFVKQILATFKE